jgi:mRNA interferase HigB
MARGQRLRSVGVLGAVSGHSCGHYSACLLEVPLTAWFRTMQRATYKDFNQLRRTFPAADYVAPFTIFNVGGNNFRTVTAIHYNRHRAYVRHVFTHPEYDEWSYEMQTQKRKGKKRAKL